MRELECVCVCCEVVSWDRKPLGQVLPGSMDCLGIHFRLPVQDLGNTNWLMPNHVDLRERGYLTFSRTGQHSDRAQKEGQKAGGRFRMPRVFSLQLLRLGLLIGPCLAWKVSDLQSQAYPHALKQAHWAASSTGFSCSWAMGIT